MYSGFGDDMRELLYSSFKVQINSLPMNPEGYAVVAVGTPTWWHTMAPAVKHF